MLLSHLWYQILETGDDVGALEFLVVTKTAGHNHHSDESDGQIKLQRNNGVGKIRKSMSRMTRKSKTEKVNNSLQKVSSLSQTEGFLPTF